MKYIRIENIIQINSSRPRKGAWIEIIPLEHVYKLE